MEDIKLIIRGITPSKKRNLKATGKDFRGKPLNFIKFYMDKPYTDWLKSAKQQLMVQKSKLTAGGTELPLVGKYNVKMIFFYQDYKKVDLSNLYEAPQDAMTGQGDEEGKWMYNIILDDSVSHIGSHDGSRFYLDKANPRVEITISDYIG